MPVRGEGADWTPVYNVIRAQHPDVPIFIFGTSAGAPLPYRLPKESYVAQKLIEKVDIRMSETVRSTMIGPLRQFGLSP